MSNVNWAANYTDSEWIELAARLKNEIKRNAEARAKSWESSDTDGFVSQWANSCMEDLAATGVDLAENRGLAEAPALFDLEGRVVSTHRVFKDYYGKTSVSWVLNDGATQRNGGKRFVGESNSVKGIDQEIVLMEKKGFRIGTIEVRSEAVLSGGGKGLSGAGSVRAVVQPLLSALESNTFRIVSTDRAPWYDSAKAYEAQTIS